MELKKYGTLLWRWVWLILIATALPAGITYVKCRMQDPLYVASTTVLIDQAPSASYSDISSILLSQHLASTYVELMTKRPVLEKVIEAIGLNMDPASLKGAIQISPVQDTQILEVSVKHSDPEIAAEIANTLITVFSEQNAELQASRYAASKENLSAQLLKWEEQIRLTEAAIREKGSDLTGAGKVEFERLQNELTQYRMSYTGLLQSYEALRLAEARSVSNLVQIEVAIPSASPIRPNIIMNSILAGVVGAMLAVGLVFLIEYLDDTVKSTNETSETLGLPMIGFIVRANGQMQGVPIAAREPLSPIAEAFRSLRSNIQFTAVQKPIRSVLITSPGPKEGKSTVAANLAVVVAQMGKSVLLVDADLRKPCLHHFMEVPNRLGLSDFFLRHPSEFSGIIRTLNDQKLSFVSSGRLPPNPSELLGSERMSQIISVLQDKYDLMIIDSPPIGVVTDASVLASRVDAVLLVVEPRRTHLGAAVQAVEQLRRADANIIGIVFNNVPLNRARYYADYFGGYYYYQYIYPYGNGKNGKGLMQPKQRNKKEKKHKV